MDRARLLVLLSARKQISLFPTTYYTDRKTRIKRQRAVLVKYPPFIVSHLELPTLKQEVFMFAGRIFHHLYS